MSDEVHLVQDEQVVDQPPVEEAPKEEAPKLAGEARVDALLIWLQQSHGFHAPVEIAPEVKEDEQLKEA